MSFERHRCYARGIFPGEHRRIKNSKNISVDARGGIQCQRVSISIGGSQKVRFTLRRQRAAKRCRIKPDEEPGEEGNVRRGCATNVGNYRIPGASAAAQRNSGPFPQARALPCPAVRTVNF